ncbi:MULTISPECIES: ABC transporter substrate-binding protein [unclassified Schaalia]|uniref:ABC transporter substrate-binding protein n=1 Tax=unclassified Schaalia TaxID=2691889 RepID=UPI001E600D25|nr:MULTISPECIES: ABC transporter substrate-binding protein [unclassified Schaalia]MCD4550319.1 ABC transporter substrate-binding protein [Schaalia sp. lx-260]MCD4557775.1 ABC transporter substrate-binding protein [Schaalia sp. lx-100]
MRSIGRIIAAAAVGTLALGLAACSNGGAQSASNAAASGQSAASAPAGGDTIYLVSKGFQHRFWQAVKEGAEQAGKEFGYKVVFVGPENEQQVTQQLDMLKSALDAKPAAIGFAALDSGAAQPVLEKIKAANIPVIAFDSGVDSDIPLTTVQTDNYAAAQEAAKHMVELIGGKGTVGLVCHDQTSETGKKRCTGFQDYMKKNAPNVKVLEPQYAGEVGLAANTTKSIIQANNDIVGIYGSNEAAATGAIQGANEVGKAGLSVVGFDSGKTQIEAIKAGTQAGAVTQAPVRIGYETVKAAIAAIKGEKLEKVIDSGFAWYDKSNIDDSKIKANLYE